jgi:hypothetical protein
MYQAIEAQCRHGRIEPLEPVVFDENETLVILRLPRADGGERVPSQESDTLFDPMPFSGMIDWPEDGLDYQRRMRAEWD